MAGNKKEPDKLAQAIGAGGGAFGPIGAIVVGVVGHWLAGEASKEGF